MFISPPCRHQALLLTGLLAGISLGACSKGGGPARTAETGSSRTDSGAVTESVTTRTDTTAAARTATSTAAPAAVRKPAARPSIDPGRKSPKRAADSSQAAESRTDSTALPTAVAAPDAGQNQPLKYDAATNTVTFELVAGPFNFKGYTSGGATLTVPSKANMIVNFVNKDGTPHSAEVISGEGPLPNAAVDPAIPRAFTNKVLEGLPQEAKDVLRFAVPGSGTYRIFCGVPGHGLSGMWIWMKVDPAAKAPSFGPTKS